MSKVNKGEPSVEKIDDYNGNESKQKRNTVRLVIIFCLVVGGFLAYLKSTAVELEPAVNQEQNIKK